MPLLFSTLSRGPTAKTAPVRVPHHAASFHEQLPQLSPFSHVQIQYTACCCSHPPQQHCLQHPLVNKQHSVQLSPRKSANSSQQNRWPCVRVLSWIDSQHSFSPGKLSAPHHHQLHHLGVATRPRCLVYLNRPRPPATTSKLAHLPSRVERLNFHLSIVHDPIPECNITYSRASFARED